MEEPSPSASEQTGLIQFVGAVKRILWKGLLDLEIKHNASPAVPTSYKRFRKTAVDTFKASKRKQMVIWGTTTAHILYSYGKPYV